MKTNDLAAEEAARAQRQEERRARQAEEKARHEAAARQADEEAKHEALAAEKTKAETLPRVIKLAAELRNVVQQGRESIIKQQDVIKRRETAVGNLEGAIISAQETSRHNPELALAKLQAAKTAFEQTK